MTHLTNWIISGLPERFPNLKVIGIESGLAWLPFMMQRLDHQYLMRQSDALVLTKLPSDYLRDMYYTSQPMEITEQSVGYPLPEKAGQRTNLRIRLYVG